MIRAMRDRPARHKDFGVFPPVANGDWIASKTAPVLDGLYAQNRAAAKMIATLDHISGARAGLNIVAGADKAEFDQMSAWDDSLAHDDRYGLAEEWTTIVKRLWAEDSVDFAGQSPRLRAAWA